MKNIYTGANWKARLKEMKYRCMEQNTPDAFIASGGRTMKLNPYTDATANGLTNCIIDWINGSGGSANRINTQGQVRKGRVEFAGGQHKDFIRFTPSTTRKGTADIHAVMEGRHLSIEVKIGPDKLSPEQIREQERITRAGGLYFVARDMQSFVEWFEELFSINIKAVC